MLDDVLTNYLWLQWTWNLQSNRESDSSLVQLCANDVCTHHVDTLKDVELFESSTFTLSCPHSTREPTVTCPSWSHCGGELYSTNWRELEPVQENFVLQLGWRLNLVCSLKPLCKGTLKNLTQNITGTFSVFPYHSTKKSSHCEPLPSHWSQCKRTLSLKLTQAHSVCLVGQESGVWIWLKPTKHKPWSFAYQSSQCMNLGKHNVGYLLKKYMKNCADQLSTEAHNM